MNLLTSSTIDNEKQFPANSIVISPGIETRGLRRVIWAMTVILGISLSVNLFLAYRIRKGGQLSTLIRLAPLAEGTVVLPIKAHSLDGAEVTISSQDNSNRLVVYVFTPQCTWCVRNLTNLKKILAEKHDAFRFVGLSLTDKDLDRYLSEKHLDLLVVMNPTAQTRNEYKLGSTPQTIVISPNGRILKNWVGAYSGATQKEIEEFFSVRLPGLNSEN